MPLTLDEITEREEGLRLEIAECERLLAAYSLIRLDRAKLVLGASLIAPAPPTNVPCLEGQPQPLLAQGSQSVPSRPKMNPALEAIASSGWGRNGMAVSWAIQQMTEDYTVSDIAALLKREGWELRSAELSVVLTRLKGRGEIEEVVCGRGRRATVYRKAANAISPGAEMPEMTGGMRSAIEIAVAE